MNGFTGRGTSGWLAHVLVWLIVLIAAVATRIDHQALPRPFGTDEADYVRALSLGLRANYLGANERSGVAFVREVVSEYTNTGWARPFQRDWERRDAAGLRHYHPPLGLYPVAALAGAGQRVEEKLRLVPVAIGIAACLCAALLASLMTEGRARPIAALIAGLLVASSPYHVAVSTELSFHAAFTLLSTLALVCLVMTSRTGQLNWWYAASAMLGLTILTVPYWLVVVPPYLWVGWWTIRPSAGTARTALSGLAGIVAALLAAWPPFLASAGFVKPVLMYGGIILKPLPGGATSGTWLFELATTHWLLVGSLATGLAGMVWMRSRVPASLIPAALFCMVFLLVNARVAHMKPLYAGDLIAPLAALAAASLVALGPVLQASVAATALGLFVHAMVSTRAPDSVPMWRSEMDALSRSLNGARVLVTPRPAGALVAYYAQGSRVVLDSGDARDVSALRAAAARSDIDVVLQWGPTFEPGGVVRELMGTAPHASFTIDRTRVRLSRLRPLPAATSDRAVP